MGDAEIESVGGAICIVEQFKFVPEFINRSNFIDLTNCFPCSKKQ